MTSDPVTDDTARDPTQSKVGRLIVDYEMEGFGDELERRWMGNGIERRSLRELADEFNHRVLRAAMTEAGETPLEGEVENLYRLLTDDETSAGARTQAERTLERQGIDTEDLRDEFVSHQAIHTYLTSYRGAEPFDEHEETNTIGNAKETIQRLQNRLVAVVEKNLRVFANTDRLTLGSFNVYVNTHVYCEDCGTQYDISELIDRRGCDCDEVTG